ncbi:MAG: OpgC domain-containing protein [Nitrospinae bacterium]|nr:OpgC domain-containing protein [Nitrospinota bacterium]
MSSSGGSSSAERDLRLDFFRGVALFSIFIDHVDWNSILAQFTLRSLGFFDAAEVFIFISGYTAGMVYGRAIERQGLLRAGMRIYHRVWQLYVAHVFLFMQFMATVAYLVDPLNNPIYAEEFRAVDFLKEPGVAVIKALTLQFQPEFMDILPLYIALLAALPFVLAGFRLWPAGVLAASFGLWCAVQLNKSIVLAAYPGPNRVWFFNPFGWQALFFLGAWCGWRGFKEGIPWLTNRWLFRLAAVSALAGFLVRFSWTLHWLFDRFPALFTKALGSLLSKTDLSPLRFVNLLVLAVLVARLIPPQAKFLAGRAAQPFIICGRHSLHVFCLGILLSTIGRLVINEFLGGALLQSAVSAVGIAIMIGTAALMDWFNAGQSPSGPRVMRASPTGGGV